MHVFLIHLLFARFFNMADDGEEFVVDKILDKRVRNGKVVYEQLPFFTASSNSISGWVLPFLEGFWARGEHMGAEREPGLPRINQGLWGQAQTEEGAGKYWDFSILKFLQEKRKRPGPNSKDEPAAKKAHPGEEIRPRGFDRGLQVAPNIMFFTFFKRKNVFSSGGTNNRSNRLLWRADVLDQVEGQRRGGPGARQTGQRQVLSGSVGWRLFKARTWHWRPCR